MPLSFLSFAGVTLPLLIPAVMLVVAYARRSSAHHPTPGRTALTTAIVLALLMAAGISLFVHTDPRSYSTPTVMVILAARLPDGTLKELAGLLLACVITVRRLRADPRVPRRAFGERCIAAV